MTKDIDSIISGLPHGITLPDDRRERFIMRSIVEHAYTLGLKRGRDDAEKINLMIEDWQNAG